MIWTCISLHSKRLWNRSDDTASSFKIYYDKQGSRPYYAYMKNVCYDFKNNTVLIYKSTDPDLSKFVAEKCISSLYYYIIISYFLLDWIEISKYEPFLSSWYLLYLWWRRSMDPINSMVLSCRSFIWEYSCSL